MNFYDCQELFRIARHCHSHKVSNFSILKMVLA